MENWKKRLFNSEKCEVIFYIKNEYYQKFVLRIINKNLKLPGIVARGPRVVVKPNLHVDLPSVMNRLYPAVVVKKAIPINADIECSPVYHTSKKMKGQEVQGAAFRIKVPIKSS